MNTILIKTRDGDEVIGERVGDSTASVTIRDPFLIQYRFLPKQSLPMISLSRYMPFSQEHIFHFQNEDVRHKVEPTAGMVHYWKYALKNYEEYIDDEVELQMLDTQDHGANNETIDQMMMLEEMDTSSQH